MRTSLPSISYDNACSVSLGAGIGAGGVLGMVVGHDLSLAFVQSVQPDLVVLGGMIGALKGAFYASIPVSIVVDIYNGNHHGHETVTLDLPKAFKASVFSAALAVGALTLNDNRDTAPILLHSSLATKSVPS